MPAFFLEVAGEITQSFWSSASENHGYFMKMTVVLMFVGQILRQAYFTSCFCSVVVFFFKAFYLLVIY